MSLNSSSQADGKAIGESLSKREQLKLEKTLRRFESQENQETKTHKRRAHALTQANEPAPRKQIKIDANYRAHPSDNVISSPSQSHEPASTTPHERPPHIPQAPQHLNPSYSISEESGGLFNYLFCYSYGQNEKQLEKETQDWSSLDKLGEETVSLHVGSPSTVICSKVGKKFTELRDRIRQPFGRAHRDFGSKFMKKQHLME